METVIKINNITKEYKLGIIGHGTLYRDLQSWWANLRGAEDPNSKFFSDAGKNSSSKHSNERFVALENVSLDIQKGDILGLIGHNGAGKSTLLKLLSRITVPSKGQIHIKGRVASLLEVGTGFHSELTGQENIYLNGTILGMTKKEIDQKFDEIVTFSELQQFIDTPVKRYSSGMTVRLAFAIAAHLDPEILVVDEVLAVGDASFRKKCVGKMQDISKEEGRTIIFVSHDMGAIRSLCNRAILLEKGRVVYDGMVEDVVQKYSDINRKKIEQNGIFKFQKKKKAFPIHISEVKLKNIQGQATSRFNSHDDMSIEVDLKGEPPQGGFNLEWRLFSSRGDKLAFGGSYALDAKTYSINDRNIKCKIENLPLAAGEYYFTLMLRIWQQEAWDYIEEAVSFEVVAPPQEETGFVYELWNSGPINISQSWE